MPRASLTLLVLSAALFAACSGNTNSNSARPESAAPAAATLASIATARTASAVAVVPGATATAASPAASPAPVTGNLIVFAASSLTDVFNQMSDAFKKTNPGINITFQYGASSALRAQLGQGAPADVFASADQANMDGARQDGSIDGPDQLFVKNKLVVVYRKNSTKVQGIQDLAKPGLNLVLTDPSVPIGNYARQALAKLAADPAYGAGFDQKVLANLKSNEANVRAVVGKVQLGEADAAIVYATDAASAAKDVTALLIPDQFNVVASYPIAIVKNAPNKRAGQAFIAFVRSAAGQEILKQAGFIVDSSTGAAM